MLLTCILARVIWTSERGIWSSEVRFLMGIQNFFLCPTLLTRQKKTSFSISQVLQDWNLFKFLKFKTFVLRAFHSSNGCALGNEIEIENPQIKYADGKTNSFLDSLFSAFLAAKGIEPDASFSFKGREKLGKLEKIHKNKFLR